MSLEQNTPNPKDVIITTDAYTSDFSEVESTDTVLAHPKGDVAQRVPAPSVIDRDGVLISERNDGVFTRLDGTVAAKLGADVLSITAIEDEDPDARRSRLLKDLALLPKGQQGFFGAHLRQDNVRGGLYRDAHGQVAKLKDHELPTFDPNQ